MTPRRAGLAVFGIIAALLVVSALDAYQRRDELAPVRAGDVAPPLSLPRLEADGSLGEDLSLASLRGQIVVLDFWATWCAPCRESMPMFERVAARHRDAGVVLVSVNVEGAEAGPKAARMLRELAPSAIGLSDEGAAADLYKVTTIPHMVVIDRDGVVRAEHRGFTNAEHGERELEHILEPLLEPLLE